MAKKSATKKPTKPVTEPDGGTDRFTLLHPTDKNPAQPIPEDGWETNNKGGLFIGSQPVEDHIAQRNPQPQPEGYLTAGLDDLPQAIEELGSEVTVALHRLLQRALGKTGNLFHAAARFQPVTIQVDRLVEYHRRAGTHRTGHRLEHGRTLLPRETPADWITRYMAEVDACCKKHGGHEDLGAELERLHKLVEDVQVSKVVEPHGAGIAEAVKSVERTKARLLAKLRETREEYAPAAAPAAALLTWLGRAGELAALVHELQRQGWIPKLSDEKQAQLVVQAFKLQDGRAPCSSGSMKTYLANKGQHRPGDMATLQLPKNKKAL